jgi:hypothetical protein
VLNAMDLLDRSNIDYRFIYWSKSSYWLSSVFVYKITY